MSLKAYRHLLEVYYLWVTPIFFALDHFGHLNLRADALPDPAVRYAYYVGLVGLGALVHWKPKTAPFVGMGESALNILLLVLSVMLPIWANVDVAAAGGDFLPVMTPAKLVNFLIVGTVLVWSFRQNAAAVQKRAKPNAR